MPVIDADIFLPEFFVFGYLSLSDLMILLMIVTFSTKLIRFFGV